MLTAAPEAAAPAAAPEEAPADSGASGEAGGAQAGHALDLSVNGHISTAADPDASEAEG